MIYGQIVVKEEFALILSSLFISFPQSSGSESESELKKISVSFLRIND